MLDLDVQIKLQGTLIARINNVAKASLREFMDNNVLPRAKDLSPDRTGANDASLSTLTRQRGNLIKASIRSNSGHGGFIEKGTAKMRAQPYMAPAFEQSLPALNGILKDRFEQFANIDTVIEDGGIQGLETAIKNLKAPRMSAASRKNRDFSARLRDNDKYLKEHGRGARRPKRKYTRKTK
jgi:HK97 gp10 family phage protein